MTQEQFRHAFEAIETEVQAGRMSISGGLARVAILAIDYGRRSARDASMTSEGLAYRVVKHADSEADNAIARVRKTARVLYDAPSTHLFGVQLFNDLGETP